MADRFSLKDHLFNADTVGQLAAEYAAGVPGFDAARFTKEVLSGFAERELLARLEWIADCAEAQLSSDFVIMADQVDKAMPPRLDPALTDDDFGQFIHAVPGILAVRHGLEAHRERAFALLHAATQRFSMEFYIRPFLNRWPEETLAVLSTWAEDDNYHVRRLVSEGTRPKLPWAKAVHLTPEQTLPLLDKLYGDPARFVTRSVANHLNDLTKSVPDMVLERLSLWDSAGRQNAREFDWIRRHALRTLIKSGHSDAMEMLGFSADAPVSVNLSIVSRDVKIGEDLQFSCEISAPDALPVLVDYRIGFARPGGRPAEKVFKLKQGQVRPEKPFSVKKSHRLKADATTFTWHPGRHILTIQVNGQDRASLDFTVIS
ncbi:MAG: hypothetical protein AAGI36_07445 [Pseudomonadota bacterium]